MSVLVSCERKVATHFMLTSFDILAKNSLVVGLRRNGEWSE